MPNSAYKVIDVIGSSETSWEDAAQRAIAVANESIHNLRVAEVVKLDLRIEEGKVVAYRTRLNLSFNERFVRCGKRDIIEPEGAESGNGSIVGGCHQVQVAPVEGRNGRHP